MNFCWIWMRDTANCHWHANGTEFLRLQITFLSSFVPVSDSVKIEPLEVSGHIFRQKSLNITF